MDGHCFFCVPWFAPVVEVQEAPAAVNTPIINTSNSKDELYVFPSPFQPPPPFPKTTITVHTPPSSSSPYKPSSSSKKSSFRSSPSSSSLVMPEGRIRAHSSPAIVVPHDRQRVLLENEMLAEDMRAEHYQCKNIAMQRLISSSGANRRVSKSIQFSDEVDDKDDDLVHRHRVHFCDVTKVDNDQEGLFSMDDGSDEFNTSPSSVISISNYSKSVPNSTTSHFETKLLL
jgi:hypothetical protein